MPTELADGLGLRDVPPGCFLEIKLAQDKPQILVPPLQFLTLKLPALNKAIALLDAGLG